MPHPSDAMMGLSTEVWAIIGSHLSGAAKKAARLVCRASREGVSETITRIAVISLPTYPATGLFRHLPAVKSLSLDCGTEDIGNSDLRLASLSLSLVATSQLRRPLPPHRLLLHGLEGLRFLCGGCTSADIGHLAAPLMATAGVANLRSLSISGVIHNQDVDGKGGKFLDLVGQALATSSGLSGLQQLSLRLHCPQITGRIVQALTSLRNLTELDLAWNNMGEAGAAHLAGVLSHPARPLSQLQTLNLMGSKLGHEGTGALARALAAATHMVSLQHLDLSWASIDEGGAQHLAETLRSAQHLSGLTCLRLGYNNMGAEGTRAVAEALQAATHIRSLRELGLRCFKATADTLAVATHLSSLRKLHLMGCSAVNEAHSVLQMSEALLSATWLRELEVLGLDNNYASQEEVVHLAGTLRQATHLSSLTSLGLRFRERGDAAVAPCILAIAVREATHLMRLRHINLDGKGLSEATRNFVESLLEGLKLDESPW